jgi:hypothetical protein
MMSEKLEGVSAFTEVERDYCIVVTQNALKMLTVNQMTDLAGGVIADREHNPDVVTERVYFFCMSWIAGAISMRGRGLRLGHCAIAFFSGAAIVQIVLYFFG